MRYFRDLECSWERFEGSWDAFGASWESPGASWQALGGILEAVGLQRAFQEHFGTDFWSILDGPNLEKYRFPSETESWDVRKHNDSKGCDLPDTVATSDGALCLSGVPPPNRIPITISESKGTCLVPKTYILLGVYSY